jgi:hypothetical protein
MANPRAKGKILHGEWPQILAKYADGETIAQIGRAYGCTAPAIRYIIKRSGMLKGVGGAPSSRRKVVSARPACSPAAPRSVAPGRRDRGLAAAALPHLASAPGRGASARLLGPQLLTRVTGDVVSFLAALDHAVLESSAESLIVLQEAVDNLMRSAARTRIELGRILDRNEAAGLTHDGLPQIENRHRNA